MNREDLYESFSGINDEILARSEKYGRRRKKQPWLKWLAAAACLCLITAAVIGLPRWGEERRQPGQTVLENDESMDDHDGSGNSREENDESGSVDSDGPEAVWEVVYNKVEKETDMDMALAYVPGQFSEELNEAGIEALLPGKQIGWMMEYSGCGIFDGNGETLGAYLNLSTTIPDVRAVVRFSKVLLRDCLTEEEPSVSQINGVEYTVYEYDGGSYILLEADSERKGVWLQFSLNISPDQLEQAKSDFYHILDCFSYYGDGKPDLASVTPESIPEWKDERLSPDEARADSDFGLYLLSEIPDGFSGEIRRVKGQNQDYLFGSWQHSEQGSIQWKVSWLDESGSKRITSIQDKENYDLSLYPIPRGETVPEQLRQMVENPIFLIEELTMDQVWARAYTTADAGDIGGYRMRFSVLYNDVVVTVTTKGISPEWVYEQLSAICP